MSAKNQKDAQQVAATARDTLPRLLAQSREFARLDELLKQHLEQIPPHAFRVACLAHGELSLFCNESVWLARLRLLQPEILRICRQLYTSDLMPERVMSVKVRIKADPAERFG